MLHLTRIVKPLRAAINVALLATAAWGLWRGIPLLYLTLAEFGTMAGLVSLLLLYVIAFTFQRSRAANGFRHTTRRELVESACWLALVPLAPALLCAAGWGAALAAASPERGTPAWIGQAFWAGLACIGLAMAGWRRITRMGIAEKWRAMRDGAFDPDQVMVARAERGASGHARRPEES